MLNASFNCEQIKKICENKACAKFDGSKELKGKVYVGDVHVASVTIPKGKKGVPPKTYKSMATQLGLEVEEFDLFLKCSMKKDEYIKIVSKRTDEYNREE